MYYFMDYQKQPYEEGTVSTPIFQMRIQQSREINELAEGRLAI